MLPSLHTHTHTHTHAHTRTHILLLSAIVWFVFAAVESLGLVDRFTKTVTNYSGSSSSGDVGDAWTAKIMAKKADSDFVPGQDMDGVDEDEWDADDDSD